jgi:hypothetical protein
VANAQAVDGVVASKISRTKPLTRWNRKKREQKKKELYKDEKNAFTIKITLKKGKRKL